MRARACVLAFVCLRAARVRGFSRSWGPVVHAASVCFGEVPQDRCGLGKMKLPWCCGASHRGVFARKGMSQDCFDMSEWEHQRFSSISKLVPVPGIGN